MSASSPERRPLTPSVLDLSDAIKTGALVVNAETPEDPVDRQHRHRQEAADATLRRWKDAVRFGSGAVLLGLAVYASAHFAFDPRAAPDERAWGRTVLASIITAGLGYYLGRGHKE